MASRDGLRDPAVARKRIFVVNGSWEFLNVMEDFLTLESYEVTAALTVPETFDSILLWKPDLIVVDLVVFDKAGWDLLSRLHNEASTRDIPTIIVSTSEELLDEARAQVDRYGGDYYLAKPFSLDDLLDRVREAIGESAVSS